MQPTQNSRNDGMLIFRKFIFHLFSFVFFLYFIFYIYFAYFVGYTWRDLLYNLFVIKQSKEEKCYYSSLTNIIIILRLILKLGLPPSYFWFAIISIYIDWIIILIFFSLQKIMPFILISLIINHSIIFILIIILTIIILPFILFKITNLKKLIAYSSINQIGWILLIILISPKIWLSFYLQVNQLLFLHP